MCGRYLKTRLARQYSVQRHHALWSCPQFLGDHSEEDPPVPIPNTAVKLLSPDGTARASVWESRTSPGLIRKKPAPKRRAFCFKPGNFLLSHIVAYAVPSGLRSLTTVFGMGTGGSSSLRSPRNWRQKGEAHYRNER